MKKMCSNWYFSPNFITFKTLYTSIVYLMSERYLLLNISCKLVREYEPELQTYCQMLFMSTSTLKINVSLPDLEDCELDLL